MKQTKLASQNMAQLGEASLGRAAMAQ